ncbi:hypothetical protein [Kitasatospora griseola]|uniref:hypothetical protein n=1 Tax=Kitasatospora griseola TaxID=2064 RepID=UPI00128C7206|nr:hypothetical protein [Kitasatospora griseola]
MIVGLIDSSADCLAPRPRRIDPQGLRPKAKVVNISGGNYDRPKSDPKMTRPSPTQRGTTCSSWPLRNGVCNTRSATRRTSPSYSPYDGLTNDILTGPAEVPLVGAAASPSSAAQEPADTALASIGVPRNPSNSGRGVVVLLAAAGAGVLLVIVVAIAVAKSRRGPVSVPDPAPVPPGWRPIQHPQFRRLAPPPPHGQ